MNRKPLFANLSSKAPAPTPAEPSEGGPARPLSREGRKQIAGFFSPDMSFALHTLARRQG